MKIRGRWGWLAATGLLLFSAIEREREIVNSNLRACQVVAGRAITAIITYRVDRKHYQRTKQLNLITISYNDQLSSKPPISLITAAL